MAFGTELTRLGLGGFPMSKYGSFTSKEEVVLPEVISGSGGRWPPKKRKQRKKWERLRIVPERQPSQQPSIRWTKKEEEELVFLLREAEEVIELRPVPAGMRKAVGLPAAFLPKPAAFLPRPPPEKLIAEARVEPPPPALGEEEELELMLLLLAA